MVDSVAVSELSRFLDGGSNFGLLLLRSEEGLDLGDSGAEEEGGEEVASLEVADEASGLGY